MPPSVLPEDHGDLLPAGKALLGLQSVPVLLLVLPMPTHVCLVHDLVGLFAGG